MSNSKLLSSLCYFSVFFAPLLLPIIIFFVTDENEVKRHAKRALVSHIIPMALLLAGFVILSFSIFSFSSQPIATTDNQMMVWSILPLVFITLYSALFLVVLIWNIYQGIKVLK